MMHDDPLCTTMTFIPHTETATSCAVLSYIACVHVSDMQDYRYRCVTCSVCNAGSGSPVQDESTHHNNIQPVAPQSSCMMH